MFKKIAFFTVAGILLLIINNLVHEIVDLWQKQTVIAQTQHELSVKQAQNNKLKQQLAQAQSPSFVEEQARDKLFLVKPGEETVVMPTDIAKKTTTIPASQDANWQQWVKLFFN